MELQVQKQFLLILSKAELLLVTKALRQTLQTAEEQPARELARKMAESRIAQAKQEAREMGKLEQNLD
jgi:hypothetical protein